MGAAYVLPLDNGSEFYSNLSLNCKSKHRTGLLNHPDNRDTYENLDARIGWRNDEWDIAAWGKNITDDDYIYGYSENVLTSAIYPIFGLDERATFTNWVVDPATYGETVCYSY